MKTLTPDTTATWNWSAIKQSLDEQGFAIAPPALSPADCAELIDMYTRPGPGRTRVEQPTYRLGPGEHQQFTNPPTAISALQADCYPHLADIAQHWQHSPPHSPRATTVITQHRAQEYQSLHQQADATFPLQLTIMLSQHRKQYTGGELLLVENHPRAQSRGRAITLKQGEMIIHPTSHRPAAGKRGHYTVSVRQGISQVHKGVRHALTITYRNT